MSNDTERIVIEEGTKLIVVVGLGGGALINQLLEKTEEGSHIILIDPAMPKFTVPTDTPKNLHLFAGISIELIDLFCEIDSKKVLLINNRADKYGDDICSQFANRIIPMKTVNAKTISELGPEMLDNMSKNSSIKADNFDDYYGIMSGVPAVLAAAGPTLDRDILYLKDKYREVDYVLICVDAALKTFLSHGMRPSIVVSCDPREKVFGAFSSIDPGRLRSTILATNLRVYPRVLSDYPGNKIVVTGKEKTGRICGGPSVTNMAFDVAKHLGCNPIILVGCDFAYTDVYLTHSRESAIQDSPEDVGGDLACYVPAIIGGTMPSNKMYAQYLKFLELQVYMYDGPVYNCSGIGARIAGTEDINIMEAFKK